MIQLRPYQSKWVEDIRQQFRAGQLRVLGQLPTGGGKTVAFSYMAKGAMQRGNKVWILAHRVELVDQISQSLTAFDVPHGFVAAGYAPRPRMSVHVCSTQTLVNRTDRLAPPDFIIVDEAHHATTKNTIGRILAATPRARVLGVTATPSRLSGEGMGEVFQSLVIGPTVAELIDAGALAPAKVYAPPTVDTAALHLRGGEFVTAEVSALVDTPKITGDAVDHYRRLASGRPFITFTASVAHARHVADDFTAAGFPCMHVDGGMDRLTRKRIIDDYRNGRLLGLSSCDLVSEGFDVPGIHVGISLRPTASETLWLQQVGRCLRVCEGKDGAIILDHAGNTLRHGLPTDEREWTLAGRERASKKGSDAVAIRVCPSCFAANRSGVAACGSCGYVFPIQPRKLEAVEGELQEVVSTHKTRKRQMNPASTLETLTELGKMRRFKDPAGWARHIMEARQKKRSARA